MPHCHERKCPPLGWPATANELSKCEDEKAGRGVGGIMETDCVLRSFGLSAGPGLYTAAPLISDTVTAERVWKPDTKGQGVKYSPQSYCSTNHLCSSALLPPVSCCCLFWQEQLFVWGNLTYMHTCREMKHGNRHHHWNTMIRADDVQIISTYTESTVKMEDICLLKVKPKYSS